MFIVGAEIDVDTGEIALCFIRAAETERALPKIGERPMGYGGYRLPVIHTFEDKLKWRKEAGDQLLRGDDPLAEERRAFTDGRSSKVTAEDVDLWETCLRWTLELLDEPRERRTLWAWAFSKAGGKPFRKWCAQVEKISQPTGLKWKNRALAHIARHMITDAGRHEQDPAAAPSAPADTSESEPPAVDEDVGRRDHANAWIADDGFPTSFSRDCDFSWADKRNRMRRRRDAKRRKQKIA